MRRIALPALAGLIALAPASPAFAQYLLPEDVLFQQGQQHSVRGDEPDTSHAAPDEEDDQQSSSASSLGNDSVTVTDGNSVTLEVDPATLRALLRLAERRANPAPDTPVLHAGAPLDEMPASHPKPLAPSGPETMVAILGLFGAMTWTLWRARRMENR